MYKTKKKRQRKIDKEEETKKEEIVLDTERRIIKHIPLCSLSRNRGSF